MNRSRKLKSAPVGVVGKVLLILELLDQSSEGLPLKDVATRTGMNKSTAHRLLTHLETSAYLFRDGRGCYRIGPRLIQIGQGATYQSTLRSLSRPVLEHLWKATGETVNLATLDGQEVLYVDVLESLHTFRLVSQVGTRRPLHCTALGKAILSHVSPSDLPEYLAHIRFERTTPRTISSLTQLKRDLTESYARGYALDDEEAVTGARCISAAIFDATGRAMAALSVSGPIVRVDRAEVVRYSRLVRSAAQEISHKLGYVQQKEEPASKVPKSRKDKAAR